MMRAHRVAGRCINTAIRRAMSYGCALNTNYAPTTSTIVASNHRRHLHLVTMMRARLIYSRSMSSSSTAPASPLADISLASTSGPSTATSSSTSLQSRVELPTHANIVIIGGGVIGCSIAYHLGLAGAKDVYLLERAQLTHGCTWHAAGLLGQLRGTKNLTKMLQYSASCFGKLHADTGIDPEWRPVGSIRVASSTERWKEICRSSSQASSFDFDMELITPSRVKELCPLLDTSDIKGAAWIPSDGHVEPTSLTNAFARGARDRGVKILQGVEIVGVKHEASAGNGQRRGKVVELHVTSKHDGADPAADGAPRVHAIRVNQVVNCAGLWARKVGAILGTNVPTINVEHQYLVTDRIVGDEVVDKCTPSFRDPDALLYFKPEQGGLVVGGWEDDTVARDVPKDFGPELYEGNLERFEPHAVAATQRVPALETTGVRKLVNGPIPITPDGEPLLGLCDEYANVFVAAGFTAGIGASGGAGKFLAEWMLHGSPSIDLWPLDIRRFATSQMHANRAWLEQRGVEAYGNYYKLHYPGKEFHSGRDVRKSAIHELTKQQGAVMGSKYGWERPLYFASGPISSTTKPAVDRSSANNMYPSFNRRQDHPCIRDWDHVRDEHRAARESCVIIDQSSFAKLEVSGRDAESFMQLITNNDVGGKPGSVTYTQMLNEKGGIEADVTIARIDKNRYRVITGSGFATRDFGHIRSHVPIDSDIALHDVTNAYGVINVAGPNSRKLLSLLGVDEDISDAAFPFMTSRTLHLSSGVSLLALRVTFVGELGYELHVPVESMSIVYSSLLSAAASNPHLGARNGGYRCLESLRLEKGYRVWGSDIGPGVTPIEAGLAFCCKWNKIANGKFIGEDALQQMKKDGGAKRKLVCFTIDRDDDISNAALGFVDVDADAKLGIRSSDPLFLYGNEAILYDGNVVGYSTSAGFGYTINKHIVYGFVPSDIADKKDAEGDQTKYQLNAYGTKVNIIKHTMNRALYDHKREKILS